MPIIYEGGDINDITTENILEVTPTPNGTFITFKVHGGEGTRTYRFANHVSEIAEAVEGFAELL